MTAIELVIGDRVVRFEKALTTSTRIPDDERERILTAARALQDRWANAAAITTCRILERQKRVVLEKLRGPKVLKGTRFWTPAKGGVPVVTKGVAIGEVWDDARWDREFTDEFLLLGASMYGEVSDEVRAELGQLFGPEVVAAQLRPEPESPAALPTDQPIPPASDASDDTTDATAAGLAATAFGLLIAGDGGAGRGPVLSAALAADVARRATQAALANRTTKALVDEVISEVVGPVAEAGLAPGVEADANPFQELHDLAQDVARVFDEAMTERARRVGEWFAAGGINEASNTTAVQVGIPTRKYWLSMRDERVRHAHRKPTDGQIREWDEPFDVDGWPMQFPGDPTAPLSLTINCRCVLLRLPPRGWRRPGRQRQDGRVVPEGGWDLPTDAPVDGKSAEAKHGDPSRPGYRLLHPLSNLSRSFGTDHDDEINPAWLVPHQGPAAMTRADAQAAGFTDGPYFHATDYADQVRSNGFRQRAAQDWEIEDYGTVEEFQKFDSPQEVWVGKDPADVAGYGGEVVEVWAKPGAVRDGAGQTLAGGFYSPRAEDLVPITELARRYTTADVRDSQPFSTPDGQPTTHRIEIPDVASLGVVVDPAERSIRLATLRTSDAHQHQHAATAIMDYLHDVFAARYPGFSIIDSGHTADGDAFWQHYTRWRPEPWRAPEEAKHAVDPWDLVPRDKFGRWISGLDSTAEDAATHAERLRIRGQLADQDSHVPPLEQATESWLYWEPNKAIRHAAERLTGTEAGAADPGLHLDPPLDPHAGDYGGPPSLTPTDQLWSEEAAYRDARVLLDALATAPPSTKPLYRAVNVPLDVQPEFDRQIASGRISVPLMAVSDDESMVDRFWGGENRRWRPPMSEGDAEAQYGADEDFRDRYGDWPQPDYEHDPNEQPTDATVEYVIEPGAPAYTSPRYTAAAQRSRGGWQEHIVGGDFDVVSDEWEPNAQRRIVTLRHARVLTPEGKSEFPGAHVPRAPDGRWVHGAPSIPKGWERYAEAIRGQEDRTSTAHLRLPTSVLAHYREFDRDEGSENLEALDAAIGDVGIRVPIWIRVVGNRAVLAEGNHRLKLAERHGWPEVPVRVTVEKPSAHIDNLRPMEPTLAAWVDQHRAELEREEKSAERPWEDVPRAPDGKWVHGAAGAIEAVGSMRVGKMDADQVDRMDRLFDAGYTHLSDKEAVNLGSSVAAKRDVQDLLDDAVSGDDIRSMLSDPKWVGSPNMVRAYGNPNMVVVYSKKYGLVDAVPMVAPNGQRYGTPEYALDVARGDFHSYLSDAEVIGTGDTPEAQHAIKRPAIRQFVHQWAETSNDHDGRSLAIQEQARRTFGMPAERDGGPADWEVKEGTTTGGDPVTDLNLNGPAYDKLLRAMYAETQRQLAENGITELTVWRGMQWEMTRDGEDRPPWAAPLRPPTIAERDGMFEPGARLSGLTTTPLTSVDDDITYTNRSDSIETVIEADPPSLPDWPPAEGTRVTVRLDPPDVSRVALEQRMLGADSITGNLIDAVVQGYDPDTGLLQVRYKQEPYEQYPSGDIAQVKQDALVPQVRRVVLERDDGTRSVLDPLNIINPVARTRIVEPALRPLSATAFRPSTAFQFGAGGTVLRMTIPASRVLSTPRSGFGAFDEDEVVILATPGQAEVVQ